MIKLVDLLTESLFPFHEDDATYDEMDDSLLAVDYVFDTPDSSYKVSFYSGEYNSEDKTFDISFGEKPQVHHKLDTFKMTGEGRVYSIVQTICKIIEEFVSEYEDDVEKLVIDPTSDKRGRVYKKLIPKYLDPAIMKIVTIK
jgi:hypothetical protein